MLLPRSFATLVRDWASPTGLAMAAVIATASLFAVGSSRLMQRMETHRVEPQTAVSTDLTGSKSGPDVPLLVKLSANGRPSTRPQAVTSVHPAAPRLARPRGPLKVVLPAALSTEIHSDSAPSPTPAPPPTLVESPTPQSVTASSPLFREPAAPPRGPFFVTTDVTEPPRIATRVEPELPKDFRNRPINDVVVVRVLVSQAGHPFRLSLLRESKAGRRLDDAVIAAVNQWTFSPARKNGEAVSCWYNLGVPIRSTGSGG